MRPPHSVFVGNIWRLPHRVNAVLTLFSATFDAKNAGGRSFSFFWQGFLSFYKKKEKPV